MAYVAGCKPFFLSAFSEHSAVNRAYPLNARKKRYGDTMMQIWRILTALAGWIGLGFFLYDITAQKSGTALIDSIINYFSYFTIISNILVASCFTLSFANPRSGIGKFMARPDVRTGIAVYIVVTGVVYLFLLSNLSPHHGMIYIANILLHYVVPVMYVLDWLFFVPKGNLRWKQALNWLAFPLVYAVYTFIHGALTGFYPYPFINVAKLGYPRVLLNCVFLIVGFALLGLVLVGTDRLLGKNKISHSLQSSREQ